MSYDIHVLDVLHPARVVGNSAEICARLSVDCVCFFFFQAEDGIRDLTVTGVQTCALPIFHHHPETEAQELTAAAPQGGQQERTDGGAPGWLAHTSLPVGEFARAGPWWWTRSEERRVGEEGRSRWAPDH